MVRKIVFVSIAAIFCSSLCQADTFTHRSGDHIYHGYATSSAAAGKTIVHTIEEGPLNLNLAEYDIAFDYTGRKNKVPVISVVGPIELDLVTIAFEKAIVEETDKGPLFILIEIDTPGGRLDLASRICGAITQTKNCRTIAFIKGGQFGGAYSAGAMISLACDKIYMAPETVIGAVTTVGMSSEGKMTDLEDILSENIAEKHRSATRNHLASLAQQNDRPGLLAKAMEDKDIEVVEVIRGGKRVFVEPANKKPGQKVVRTWSQKGSLLTLPAKDAVQCTIADKTVLSREELLVDTDASLAAVEQNTKVEQAKKEFKRLDLRLKKLSSTLDLQYKTAMLTDNRAVFLKSIRKLIKEFKDLKKLSKRYPDVNVDQEKLDEQLNTLQAHYSSMKRQR